MTNRLSNGMEYSSTSSRHTKNISIKQYMKGKGVTMEIVTDEKRAKRARDWDNNLLVQVSKQLDIQLGGDYFDYLSGRINLMQADYKIAYKGKEIVIGIQKSDTWRIYPRTSTSGYIKDKRVSVVRSAIKEILTMSEEMKINIDNDIKREEFESTMREFYREKLGSPCAVRGNNVTVYTNDGKDTKILISFNMSNVTLEDDKPTEVSSHSFNIPKTLPLESVRKIIDICKNHL